MRGLRAEAKGLVSCNSLGLLSPVSCRSRAGGADLQQGVQGQPGGIQVWCWGTQGQEGFSIV